MGFGSGDDTALNVLQAPLQLFLRKGKGDRWILDQLVQFIHFPSEPVGFTCPFHQFGVLARVAVTQVVEWHGPRVRLLLAGWSGRGGAGGARGGRTGPARLIIAGLRTVRSRGP